MVVQIKYSKTYFAGWLIIFHVSRTQLKDCPYLSKVGDVMNSFSHLSVGKGNNFAQNTRLSHNKKGRMRVDATVQHKRTSIQKPSFPKKTPELRVAPKLSLKHIVFERHTKNSSNLRNLKFHPVTKTSKTFPPLNSHLVLSLPIVCSIPVSNLWVQRLAGSCPVRCS